MNSPRDAAGQLAIAVRALRSGLIDEAQLAEVCSAWVARPDIPPGLLLLERGWIRTEDHLRLMQQQEATAEGTPPLPGRRLLAVLDEATCGTVCGQAGPEPDLSIPTIDSPSAPLTASALLPAGARYTLLRQQGKGGMGLVWVAQDNLLNREVALKELRPDRAEDQVLRQRLLHEAQVTGQLQHPGIVPVYDLIPGREAGQVFYTMRLVEGRNLREAVREFHQNRSVSAGARQGFRSLISAFVSICNTIAYAHHRGVIHRDLKGENVVLGPFGEVVVLDWGLARRIGAAEEPEGARPGQSDEVQQTLPGVVVGTPGYMAPEQAAGQGDRVGPASDVYGLGAILYLILTGQAPFQGADLMDVLRRVQEEAPRPPHQLWSGVPRALEAICLRALAKDPAARYPGAAELAAEGQRWLDDERVTAYREPMLARLARFGRRHRALVTGLGALLLTTVLGLVLGIIAVKREQHNTEEKAEEAKRQAILARESLRKGLQAIDVSLNRTSSGPLGRVPGMQQVQRAMLRSALEGYQELEAIWGEEPSVRREVGLAWVRLGTIAAEVTTLKEGIALQEKGYRYQKALAEQAPDHLPFQQDLATSARVRGGLLWRVGEHAQAIAALKESLEIQKRLLRHPEVVADPSAQALLGNGLGLAACNLARSLNEMGRPDDARSYYEEGVRHAEEAMRLSPTNPYIRANLADVSKERGFFLYGRGEHSLARPAVIQARELLEKLPEAERNTPSNLKVLGDCHNLLYLIHRQLGEKKEALASIERAVAVRQKQARDNPDVPQRKAECASSLANLGSARADEGDLPGAIEALARSSGLFEELLPVQGDLPGFRASLSRVYLRLAQHQRKLDRFPEALMTLAKCQKILPADAENLFRVGCELALCAERLTSERGKTAAQAIQVLREAIRQGFKDGERFRKEVPMEVLRSQADWPQLEKALGLR